MAEDGCGVPAHQFEHQAVLFDARTVVEPGQQSLGASVQRPGPASWLLRRARTAQQRRDVAVPDRGQLGGENHRFTVA